MVAYGLCALALVHAIDARLQGRGEPLAMGAGFVAVAVLAQAAIGIMTLTGGVPIELALLHQAVALLVLTGATLHAARTLSSPPLDLSAKAPEGDRRSDKKYAVG
jgi:heme a synthase